MLAAVVGMVEVEEPVGHVDPVDHQVGEDAAAEVPEPPPLPEAILVERLLLGACRGTASSRRSSDRCSSSAAPNAVAVAVPGEVDLVNLAELARLDDLRTPSAMCGMLRCCVPTCTMRLWSFWASMTALPFGQIVRQRLLDVDILARRARVDRHRHVPVVGRADEHRVDVLAIQQRPVVFRRERLRLGQLLRPSSKWKSQMSQTAAIFTPGIVASDCISLRQRPPVPMQPTVIVSLAAKPLAVAVYPAVIAPAAATPSDSSISTARALHRLTQLVWAADAYRRGSAPRGTSSHF